MKLKYTVPFVLLILLSGCEFNGDIWSEINAKLDGTPPVSATLNTTTPYPTQSIILTFNEEIAPGSVNGTSIVITDGATTFIDYTTDVNGNEVIITPNTNFTRSTAYTITANPPLADLYRNEVAATIFTGTFTPPGYPTVTATVPANGASNISPTNLIYITFSEPMASAGYTIDVDGPALSATVNPAWNGRGTFAVNLGQYLGYAVDGVSTVTIDLNDFEALDGVNLDNNADGANTSTFTFDMRDAWVNVNSTTITAAAYVNGYNNFKLLETSDAYYLVVLDSAVSIYSVDSATATDVTTLSYVSPATDISKGVSAVVIEGAGTSGADLIYVAYVQNGGTLRIDQIDTYSGTAINNNTTTRNTDYANLTYSSNNFYLSYIDADTSIYHLYRIDPTSDDSTWTSLSTSWVLTSPTSSSLYSVNGTEYITFTQGANVHPCIYSGSLDSRPVITLPDVATNTQFVRNYNGTGYYCGMAAADNSFRIYTNTSWTSMNFIFSASATPLSAVTIASPGFGIYIHSNANYTGFINSAGYPVVHTWNGSAWIYYNYSPANYQDLSRLSPTTSTNIQVIVSPSFETGIVAAYQSGTTIYLVKHIL